MGTYILRRCLYAVLILVGVNLLTFTLFFAVNSPDNIARLNIGGKRVSADAIEQMESRARLRQAAVVQPLRPKASTRSRRRSSTTVRCGCSRSTSAPATAAARSGTRSATRIVASLALAGPMLVLTVFVGITFSLLLVFFRASYLDFWGTVLCVVMMSISSLFYIIMAQWFFGKTLKLVPLSGFVPGLDLLKFLALPIIVGIVFQLGSEARLFRAMLLEEVEQGLRAHRALERTVRSGRAVPPRAAQLRGCRC